MKSIAIKDLSENFFEVIGKEWMLVTAGSKEHFNTMTASWGGIGWLWNKPVVLSLYVPSAIRMSLWRRTNISPFLFRKGKSEHLQSLWQ